MSSWSPTTAPRTWVAGMRMHARKGNELRDQISYMKGALSADGNFVTLTAAAIIGATQLETLDLPSFIPAGTVLRFRSGPNSWAKVASDAEAGDNTLNVEALKVALVSGDVAAWPHQEQIQIDANSMRVTPGLSTGVEEQRHEQRMQHLGGGAQLRLLAQKVAALVNSDRCDLLIGLRKTDGTVELYARIRAFRDGSATNGSVSITTATGGAFPATPAFIITGAGRVGWNTAAPGAFTGDVAGTLDLTGDLIGVSLWREDVAGTLRYLGPARVTHQLRSTVATGTAPFSFTSDQEIKMIGNLNVDGLQGRDWPNAPTTATGSNTIASNNTDFDIASGAVPGSPASWIYTLVGSVTIDMVAGDAGALFTIRLKIGSTIISLQDGTVREGTARKVALSVIGNISIAASSTVKLICRKASGSGTTTAVDGSFKLVPYGFT